MIPKYKRPNIREYIEDVSSMTDQDLDMIVYVEKLELYKKAWEELKKQFINKRKNGYNLGSEAIMIRLYNILKEFEELETKYGIGVE